MRRSVILSWILSLAFFAASCISERSSGDADAAEPAQGGTAEITFNQIEHDFGEVEAGEKVACVFTFTNTGNGDLLIHSATTSCGCTVPRFDDKPVKPGEKGTLEVVFDSSYREGTQTKTITVRSNAAVKVVVLRITAEVINNK